MTNPKVFKFGPATIEVASDDFEDGYTQGLFAFEHIKGNITTADLYQVLANCFINVRHSSEWNTGYLVGAFHSLRIINLCDQVELDEARQDIFFGQSILRMNRLQFAAAYHEGMRLHQERHEWLPTRSPRILRAHELLHAIAHYQPRSDHFYLGSEEVRLAEQTFGQFLGYFCASLFPDQHQRHRVPLPAIRTIK